MSRNTPRIILRQCKRNDHFSKQSITICSKQNIFFSFKNFFLHKQQLTLNLKPYIFNLSPSIPYIFYTSSVPPPSLHAHVFSIPATLSLYNYQQEFLSYTQPMIFPALIQKFRASAFF